jgi:teichuronic acid biosynthesis glycosyltransferase TuaG
MPETVSVVIPAWRAAGTLVRALASVAAQTVKPLEAIVVDDGSDDGTAAIAESCRASMNGVELVVIRQNRQGPGAARNAAIAAARGSVLAFLDADDEWLPAKIERSLAQLGDRVLVAHDYIEVREGRETLKDCTRHFRDAADPLAALFVRNYLPSITVLARTDAVRAAGGFEANLPAAQDYDLWLKLLTRQGARFTVFPEALARYHVSDTGITSQVERRRRCSLAVLARHAPALRPRGLAALGPVLGRALVVQFEAVMAHRQRGAWARALATLLATPFVLIAAPAAPYPILAPAAGLAWATVVFAAHHLHSHAYYTEKLGVFGRFLLGRLGIG